MITISFGKPKIKVGLNDETAQEQSMFSVKNGVLLGTGVALGIILKQQADIHMLKRTITCLQEIIR